MFCHRFQAPVSMQSSFYVHLYTTTTSRALCSPAQRPSMEYIWNGMQVIVPGFPNFILAFDTSSTSMVEAGRSVQNMLCKINHVFLSWNMRLEAVQSVVRYSARPPGIASINTTGGWTSAYWSFGLEAPFLISSNFRSSCFGSYPPRV